MKKITLLISLVIILNAPISAYAQATSTTPTVTIAAGSGAAVGGIYQQNGSKTAMAATALTLAVLSATGAAVKLTDASIQAGKTVYQVINDKFAQWVGGTSAEELSPNEAEELQSRFKVITGGGGDPDDSDNNQNNGTNIGEDGKLWFSPGSLAMLKKFTDWLQDNDQVNSYVESTGNGTVDIGDYTTITLNEIVFRRNYANYGYRFTFSDNVAVFLNGSESSNQYSNITFISNHDFTCNKQNLYFSYTDNTIESSGTPSSENVINYNGYYYYSLSTGVDGDRLSLPSGIAKLNYSKNPKTLIDMITQWNEAGQGTTIDNDGIYAGENWDNSLLNNPNNQSLVIDPGILPYINPTSDQQLAIPDYLQLLIDQAQANATAQNQPINVPAIDPATLEVTPLEVPVIEQDPISDPVPSEEADPIETPDNPVQDPEEVPTPEEAVELMKVDLTKIFPFCIPWDLYRLLSKFNAEPVTPSITIDWGNIFGSLGVDFETTLDLHDYDSVASVLRTMETVVFVVGLAVATRSIFLQS